MFGISVIANQAKSILNLSKMGALMYSKNEELQTRLDNVLENSRVYIRQNEKCLEEITNLKKLVKRNEIEYGDVLLRANNAEKENRKLANLLKANGIQVG